MLLLKFTLRAAKVTTQLSSEVKSKVKTFLAGRQRFRDDRNQWYFDRTGKHLSDAGSSTKEQGEAFDLLARNYRERGDRGKGKKHM